MGKYKQEMELISDQKIIMKSIITVGLELSTDDYIKLLEEKIKKLENN